ncbi:MAG: CoA transferase subunit A [Candidatus Tectomicrobia bacterium]|uniref:CoA transferase subunit A n=1 Tax=Tectimicrobiota bacterium TaxID=2528274 RepID=A0A932GMQ9_UNCTE|nr:CoA transferase subunit A [Candidatus Tectomicrobia bacterium]
MERRPKVKSLEEAVQVVKDGTTLAMTATHYNSVPMAAIRQIVRQGSKKLTVIPTPSAGLAIDLLIAAGLLEICYVSYVGLEFLGLAPNFRKAVESHSLKIFDVDEPTIIMGFKAAAAGIPFMPLPPYYRLTDFPRVNPYYREITDPFTGKAAYAVPPLCPDVAIIHVQQCDPFGNARQLGGNHTESLIAKAANHVIVTTEEVIPLEDTMSDPLRTTIPGILVNSVVKLPYGAHPGACPARYNYDEEHLKRYATLAKEGRTAEYIEEFVFARKDHSEYLEKIGAGRLRELQIS